MRPAGEYVPGLWPGRRALVSDIDGTLLDGGAPGTGAGALGERLRNADAALVLSSGRDLAMATDAARTLEGAGLPRAAGLVCGVGTEVYLLKSGRYALDETWSARLASTGFDPERVRDALLAVEGLSCQPEAAQGEFKVSYFVDRPVTGDRAVEAATATLASAGLAANLVYSAGRYLDVLPSAASKGTALLHLAGRFGLTGVDVVTAGDSGNDRELLLTAARAGMVAVLVANHEPEMAELRGAPGILVAERSFCAGVLEGLDAAGW